MREPDSLDEQALNETLYAPAEGDQFTLALAPESWRARMYRITRVRGKFITYHWQHEGDDYSLTSVLPELRKLGMTRYVNAEDIVISLTGKEQDFLLGIAGKGKGDVMIDTRVAITIAEKVEKARNERNGNE
jgi:hypothetical protein